MTTANTDRNDDAQQARERLLDILLEEELVAAAAEPAQELRIPKVRQRPRVLVAAALVLGVSAVAASAWLQRTGGDGRGEMNVSWALPPQDPADPAVVVVRDVDHYRELIGQARAVFLVRQEYVGAARKETEAGSADTLTMLPWPETLRFAKGEADGAFERWSEALKSGLGRAERQSGVEDVVHLELELPNGRRTRSFVSVAGDGTYLFVGKDAFFAAAELRELLVSANEELERLHKQARGIVNTPDELDRLPDGIRRVALPDPSAFSLEQLASLRQMSGLRELCLCGNAPVLERFELPATLETVELEAAELDMARMESLLELKGLRKLVLRRCTGLDRAALARLTTLTRLETLHCVDTLMGEDGEAFDALASLASLRDFGLRGQGVELSRELIEMLLRTKLSRILLVDVHVEGDDLAVLAALPTLRELAIVTNIGDDDLESLQVMRGLRRLVVRNAKVTDGAAKAFRAALPGCELDWQFNARYFDTVSAFR